MPFTKFYNYLNPVFIETGSYYGDGIRAALDCGFDKVYSIEITNKYFSHCSKRFENDLRVHLYYGDSAEILYNIIEKIDSPITFWLDSHWSGNDTGFGFDKYPLLLELKQIAKHPIKTHIILIDDVRLFNTEWQIGPISLIEHKILSINPEYKFSFEDGFVLNDVLVARV